VVIILLVMNVIVAFIIESFSAQKTKRRLLQQAAEDAAAAAAELAAHSSSSSGLASPTSANVVPPGPDGQEEWRLLLARAGVDLSRWHPRRRVQHWDIYDELYRANVRSEQLKRLTHSVTDVPLQVPSPTPFHWSCVASAASLARPRDDDSALEKTLALLIIPRNAPEIS
jgi:hypothetical protein